MHVQICFKGDELCLEFGIGGGKKALIIHRILVVNVTRAFFFIYFSGTERTSNTIVSTPWVLTRLQFELWLGRMKVKTQVMNHHVFKTVIVG